LRVGDWRVARLFPSQISPALGFGELDSRAVRRAADSAPVEFAEPQRRRDIQAKRS
jgi:hypothetical protein